MKYHITRGHQYDRHGANVSYGNMILRLSEDGAYDSGEPIGLDHMQAVTETALRVMATGIPEMLELGAGRQDTPTEVAEVDHHLTRMARMMDSGDSIY